MPNKLYKVLLVFGVIIVILAIPAFWLSYSAVSAPKDELEVDFLDIGQGDSILIKTPAGQNILIDGGPDNTVIKKLSENLPWWERTIDLMVLTHPHSDHVSGLVPVLGRYKVKRILYTGALHSIPEYLEWLNLIQKKKIPLTIIDRPQSVLLGDNCRLEILHPFESLAGKEINNLNNSSIVIKLIYKQVSFLLAGDIEKEVEEELINVGADLAANVFKANHQGSNTSNTEEFLQAVNPEIIVITVGKDNQFGHPHKRVLKRFERTGAKIFRNDIGGTVKIISNGNKIDIIN